MNKRGGLARWGLWAAALLTLAAAGAAGWYGWRWFQSRELDQVLFQDATAGSGVDAYRGMTFGAAWGDIDGDGRPDLYLTNHLQAPLLLRNLGSGRFADVTAAWLQPEQAAGDKHGAVFADFDNDGRLDLMQLTGAVQGAGEEPKRLFRNLGGRFDDVAVAKGVVNLQGRTRMPLWVDLDRDGRLDLLQGAEARHDALRPPMAFAQRPPGFEVMDAWVALQSRSAPFCVLTDLQGSARLTLLCRLMEPNRAVQVLDLGDMPARTLELLPQTAFEDVAAADFDSDGRIDVFMARKYPPGAVAFGRPSPREVVAGVLIEPRNVERPAGFDFRGAGPLRVRLATATAGVVLSPAQVLLGEARAHPAGLDFEVAPTVGPLPAAAPGEGTAVAIGFKAPDLWQVRVTAPRQPPVAGGRARPQEIQVQVTSPSDITDLAAVGPTQAEEAPARLFMNRGDAMVEESGRRGVGRGEVAGVNVVAADFDNDMCTDLFVLGSGDVGAQRNLLLLNDCRGSFRAVKGAGGAQGPLAGVGDSVTVADVDGDGRLDLLVASGGSMGRSLGLPAAGGGYRLYRNVAQNQNHWLQLDLVGTRSNRDGIGAVVRVEAGGVTQTRVQDGGVHHRGQNHARLHFGLGRQAAAERVVVRWPSGTEQVLTQVKGDRVLRVEEPPARP